MIRKKKVRPSTILMLALNIPRYRAMQMLELEPQKSQEIIKNYLTNRR